MPDCPRCGERMSHNDETTKLTEFVCSRCHTTRIVQKGTYRTTA
jgi:transposase-like protein